LSIAVVDRVAARVADGGLARGFGAMNCFIALPGEPAFDAANAVD
jgi:hypothetical protein